MAIDVTKKPKISLSKVVLEKTGDTHKVDLSKSNEQITINLNWTKNKNSGLFANLFNKNQDIDLDLGCYYELNNGEASVIDGLQFSHNRGGAKIKELVKVVILRHLGFGIAVMIEEQTVNLVKIF